MRNLYWKLCLASLQFKKTNPELEAMHQKVLSTKETGKTANVMAMVCIDLLKVESNTDFGKTIYFRDKKWGWFEKNHHQRYDLANENI